MNCEGQTLVITANINRLENLIGQMDKQYADYLLCVVDDKRQSIYDELILLVNNIYKLIGEIFSQLKKLKPYGHVKDMQNKMQQNVYNMLLQKCNICVTTFTNSYNTWKQKEREHIRRDIKIKFPGLSKDVIDSIMADAMV